MSKGSGSDSDLSGSGKEGKKKTRFLESPLHWVSDKLLGRKYVEDPNLKFYQGIIPAEPDGVYIDEIHSRWFYDMDRLEYSHGYIQWLFPISESGGLNAHSEALQPQEVVGIREDPQAMRRFRKSYEMMLNFYGMQIIDYDTGEVIRAANWKKQFENLNLYSHNYLRITRILKSLCEMGLERYLFPFIKFMLFEAIVTRELSRTLNSCYNYWISTVPDETERAMLVQIAVDLKAEVKHKEETERAAGACDLLTGREKTPIQVQDRQPTESTSLLWMLDNKTDSQVNRLLRADDQSIVSVGASPPSLWTEKSYDSTHFNYQKAPSPNDDRKSGQLKPSAPHGSLMDDLESLTDSLEHIEDIVPNRSNESSSDDRRYNENLTSGLKTASHSRGHMEDTTSRNSPTGHRSDVKYTTPDVTKSPATDYRSNGTFNMRDVDSPTTTTRRCQFGDFRSYMRERQTRDRDTRMESHTSNLTEKPPSDHRSPVEGTSGMTERLSTDRGRLENGLTSGMSLTSNGSHADDITSNLTTGRGNSMENLTPDIAKKPTTHGDRDEEDVANRSSTDHLSHAQDLFDQTSKVHKLSDLLMQFSIKLSCYTALRLDKTELTPTPNQIDQLHQLAENLNQLSTELSFASSVLSHISAEESRVLKQEAEETSLTPRERRRRQNLLKGESGNGSLKTDEEFDEELSEADGTADPFSRQKSRGSTFLQDSRSAECGKKGILNKGEGKEGKDKNQHPSEAQATAFLCLRPRSSSNPLLDKRLWAEEELKQMKAELLKESFKAELEASKSRGAILGTQLREHSDSLKLRTQPEGEAESRPRHAVSTADPRMEKTYPTDRDSLEFYNRREGNFESKPRSHSDQSDLTMEQNHPRDRNTVELYSRREEELQSRSRRHLNRLGSDPTEEQSRSKLNETTQKLGKENQATRDMREPNETTKELSKENHSATQEPSQANHTTARERSKVETGDPEGSSRRRTRTGSGSEMIKKTVDLERAELDTRRTEYRYTGEHDSRTREQTTPTEKNNRTKEKTQSTPQNDLDELVAGVQNLGFSEERPPQTDESHIAVQSRVPTKQLQKQSPSLLSDAERNHSPQHPFTHTSQALNRRSGEWPDSTAPKPSVRTSLEFPKHTPACTVPNSSVGRSMELSSNTFPGTSVRKSADWANQLSSLPPKPTRMSLQIGHTSPTERQVHFSALLPKTSLQDHTTSTERKYSSLPTYPSDVRPTSQTDHFTPETSNRSRSQVQRSLSDRWARSRALLDESSARSSGSGLFTSTLSVSSSGNTVQPIIRSRPQTYHRSSTSRPLPKPSTTYDAAMLKGQDGGWIS